MARLSADSPVRPLRVSSRALTGKVTVTEESAAFESSLERNWLEVLDFDRRVLVVQVQPFQSTTWWRGKSVGIPRTCSASLVGPAPSTHGRP